MNKLIYLFVTFLFYGTLLSQDELYIYKYVGSHVVASASKYVLGLNEETTINIKFTAPYDIKADEYSLGIWLEDGMKLLNGTNQISRDLKEGEALETTVSICFTKKKVYRVGVRYKVRPDVILFFYVDNALPKSNLVYYVEDNIIEYRKFVDSLKKAPGELTPPPTIYFDPNENYEEMPYTPYNKYEKNNIGKIILFNKEYYTKLRKEFDSLKAVVEEINNERRFKNDYQLYSGKDSTYWRREKINGR